MPTVCQRHFGMIKGLWLYQEKQPWSHLAVCKTMIIAMRITATTFPSFIRCYSLTECRVLSLKRPVYVYYKVSNNLFEPVGHTVIQGLWNLTPSTLKQNQELSSGDGTRPCGTPVQIVHVWLVLWSDCHSEPFKVIECQLWQLNYHMSIFRSTWFLWIAFLLVQQYLFQ